MVSLVNKTYQTSPGGILHLGKIAPAGPFAPLRVGGVVHSLVSGFSGSGFQLLTTTPGDPIYRPSTHGAATWDDVHDTLWIFGSETHNTDMDNAVYGWRASDGKIIKHYDADDKLGYIMDANGVYYSSAEKVRPWAMHAYRRMRFIPATNEIEVVFDAHEHASLTTPVTYENPAHTAADRVPPFWYYNVVTGAWRASTFGQSSSFAGEYFQYPVGYDINHGWFVQNGSFWKRLSNEGVLTTENISGKSTVQYHSYMHVHNGVAYQVGGNANTTLYTRHPLNNIQGSSRYANNLFPALNGKDTTNMASVKMPDGRILIFPVDAARTTLHAMILDPEASTVVDTGFTVTGLDGTSNYEFGCDWSTRHNCAIMLLHRFSPDCVYAFRPE